VVCPHPPLLLPELARGAAGTLDGLLAACDAALADALALRPHRVVVLGAGESTARFAAGARGAAAGFGAPDPAELASAPPLPLSLTVGRFLLTRSQWPGAVEFWSVADRATPGECVALGKGLADGPATLFLVLGDGSGVGRNAPPGAAVPAAEPFDDAVWAALCAVDTAALLAVDVAEAQRLKAAGRAAWQVLAGAVDAAGGAWSARARHRESPYGVGYFVVSWSRG
jgi:hypothetical protein